jgi:ketosteroid isomerase-like protein
MASDADQVKDAFLNYIAALNSLDLARIERLWAHDDTVTQVEPDSETITVGWPAVRRNLENFFGGFSEVKIEIANGPHVQVVGNVGWTTSITPARAKTKAGDALTLRVCTTQVFEKRGGVWLIRSNIALPVPQQTS